MEDFYNFIVSPENIRGDLFTIDYNGVEVGVYSAMTQVVTSGIDGSSLLTGLTIPILIKQNTIDYYLEKFRSQIDLTVLSCLWK
jgi:hypothetical protein